MTRSPFNERRRSTSPGGPVGGAPRSRRWSTLRFFVAIQVAAVVPVVAVGLVIDEQNQQQETAETLRDARSQAQTLADLVIAPHLLGADLRQADPAVAQAALPVVLSDPDVRAQTDRVTVWDLAGRVVASDDPALVGTRSTPDRNQEAAAAGSATAQVAEVTETTSAGGRKLVRVVDVIAPLRTVTDRSTSTGVVQLHLPYDELAGDLADARRDLHRTLAVTLAALLAALATLTWPVLIRLERHVEAAERAAVTDPLTGLRNRAGLQAELAAGAAAGQTGCLVLAGVSELHQINEASADL